MLSAEERQFVYHWFNAMLARELSDEQLNALQEGKFDDFFAFLKELGFTEIVANIQAELTACQQFEFPRLELAADFAQLFLLDGQQSALPYASAYLEGESLAQNLAEMDRLLTLFSLQINKETKEPSDHLCVYLSLLERLIEHSDISEQQHFLVTQLNSWLPMLIEKAHKVSTKTYFYQNVLELLHQFITLEIKKLVN